MHTNRNQPYVPKTRRTENEIDRRSRSPAGEIHALTSGSEPPSAFQRTQDTSDPQESRPASEQTEEVTETVGPDGADGPETVEEPEEGYDLPLDQTFEILKNSRRRETLQYLKEHGGEATLSEVAEHIAAIENETTVQAISSTQRKRVYVGLYQCHLPKMDDTDVVDFDQNRGTIELGPNAGQLDPYLDEPDRGEWHKIYLGITAAGAALFAVGQAGAQSYGLTPSVVLGLMLVGITTCGVLHSRRAG